MLVPLPFQPEIFPNGKTYRLNVWAIANLLNLDVVRLQHYRDAVKSGFYSDEIKP